VALTVRWIDVSGYDPVPIEAATKAKARYRAFLAFREAFGTGISFRDFLARGVHVQRSAWV
jgi:hypothetical protein